MPPPLYFQVITMQIEEFLGRLDGVKRSGDGHTAKCPAHPDQHNSLSIAVGEKGIVIRCHAGCDVEAVVGNKGTDQRRRRLIGVPWTTCSEL